IADVLHSAALHVFDVIIPAGHLVLLLVITLASYGIALYVVRRLGPAKAVSALHQWSLSGWAHTGYGSTVRSIPTTGTTSEHYFWSPPRRSACWRRRTRSALMAD